MKETGTDNAAHAGLFGGWMFADTVSYASLAYGYALVAPAGLATRVFRFPRVSLRYTRGYAHFTHAAFWYAQEWRKYDSCQLPCKGKMCITVCKRSAAYGRQEATLSGKPRRGGILRSKIYIIKKS